jgi:Domain of unknown function (DUF4115)
MSGRHRRSATARRGRHRRPPPRGRLIVPALAATVVLGGGGTALGFAVGGPGGSTVTPQITPFAAPVVLSTAPVVDPTPSVSATSTRAPQPTPSHPAKAAHRRPTDTLILRVTGSESYVQVATWNNHLLVQRILHHGQRLAYHQHGLRVVLGNAGAVRLRIAGHSSHVAGRLGEVRHFRVN